MIAPPIDELYFKWLYCQVGSVLEKNPSRSYFKLLGLLHEKDFVWIVPHDDNRAEDGRGLRREFLEYEDIHSPDPVWMRYPCSMLELLIGLSRRLNFLTDAEPRVWFWQLMENLGLDKYNDNTLVPDVEIDKVLENVIWRTYDRKGRGGLFPLRRPHEDQRDVELWDQMHAYLLEMD